MKKMLLVLLLAGMSLLLLPKSAAAQDQTSAVDFQARMFDIGAGFVPQFEATCKRQIDAAIAAGDFKRESTEVKEMVVEGLFSLTEAEFPTMLAEISKESKPQADLVRCIGDMIFKIRQPGKTVGPELKTTCKAQLDAARGKMKEPMEADDFIDVFIPQLYLYLNDPLLAELTKDMTKDSPQAGALGRCVSTVISNRLRNAPSFTTFVMPAAAEVARQAQAVLPELQGPCAAQIRALPAGARGARGAAATPTPNALVLDMLGRALFRLTEYRSLAFLPEFFEEHSNLDNPPTEALGKCVVDFVLKRNKEKGPVPKSEEAVAAANITAAATMVSRLPNVPAPTPAPAPAPVGSFTINVIRTLGDGCVKMQAAGTVATGNVFETTLELRNTCSSIELVEVLGSVTGSNFTRGGTWVSKDSTSDPTVPVAADRKVAPRPTAAALGFTPLDNALGGAYFRMSPGSVMERKIRHPEANAKIDAVLASCRTWENDVEPYIAYRDANATVFVCKPYLQMPGTN